MRIGVSIGGATIDEVVERAQAADEAGFHSGWVANIFGLDAMSAIAVAGREVRRLELGSAVVPIYSRHPYYMAQQAMTTQAASGGRFVLGIGLSHKLVIETILGLSFEHPAQHMEEYLNVLLGVLERGNIKFQGDRYRVDTSFAGLERMGTTPPDVMIAALGPRMLRLAGAMTAGTITWMSGHATIGSHIAPILTKSAAEAGRGAPRIVAGVPVAVTDDIAGARQSIATSLQVYGTLPSYRAMLDKEGADGPADVALIGDAQTVRDGIRRYEDAGVTDFHAALGGDAVDERTFDALQSML